MKNLDELALQLHEDLERITALRRKGLRAYFETLNRQQRQKRIHKQIEKLDAAFGLKRKYDEN